MREFQHWVMGALVASVFTVLVTVTPGAQQAGTGGAQVEDFNVNPVRGPVDLGLTDPVLAGAIDVHAHQVVPLRIPSEKIKILGGFTVTEDGLTTVTLDFVAEESLVLLGNGEWLLQPVILMEVSTS